jgi:undecaprenyl diphosphate synthase
MNNLKIQRKRMIGALKRATTHEEAVQLLLDQGYKLPRHVAIIMDGNGRWAKRRSLPRAAGHREGVKSVRKIVEIAGKLGIEHLTLYTFSKENWRRPQSEVSTLMKLLVSSIRKEIDDLMDKNVRLRTIGDMNDLPEEARNEMLAAVERTRYNTGLNLNLALSYSSRVEMVQAVKNIAQAVKEGRISVDEIDEDTISQALYTSDIPDPDLLIRTSGEQRISNFLLWQLAYSELYITRTFWPDFREEAFCEALIDYMHRERRFGMTSEQIQQ